MRKEVLFAVGAGTIFGLVVALGIWRANSALKVERVISEEVASEPKEVIETRFDLVISEPQERDVVTNSPVSVRGITSPDVWITISGESEDYIFKSEKSGEFNQEIELDAGVNQLIVTAFSNQGQSIEKSINLVYSTQFAKSSETPE